MYCNFNELSYPRCTSESKNDGEMRKTRPTNSSIAQSVRYRYCVDGLIGDSVWLRTYMFEDSGYKDLFVA